MKMLTPLFLTAGALALLVSTPSLGQSTESLSLNYEEIAQTSDGVEPDEIDHSATDEEPQAGLLLPAVQNVQAQGNRPQPRTPVLLEVEDIEGETTDNAASARPEIVTGAGTVTQPRTANRPSLAERGGRN